MPTAQGHIVVTRQRKGDPGTPAVVYSLQPSVSSITYDPNTGLFTVGGTQGSSARILVTYTKTTGNVVTQLTSLPSGYKLYASIDGGGQYSQITDNHVTTSDTKPIILQLKQGVINVDMVTIPVVVLGEHSVIYDIVFEQFYAYVDSDNQINAFISGYVNKIVGKTSTASNDILVKFGYGNNTGIIS